MSHRFASAVAVTVALVVTVAALSAQQQPRVPDPEPPTRGAAPPSALRPLVAGPNGGVSTGHPLVTSAALEILLKGGNAFDAGVGVAARRRRRRAGSLQPRRRGAGAGLSREQRRRSPRSSARAGRRRPSTSTGTCRAARRCEGAGLDPAVVPGALHARAHRAREVGHDELRDRCRRAPSSTRARLPDAAEHGRRRSRRKLEFFKQVARTTSATG